MIAALTNASVFACHCEVKPDGIHVGILAVDEDFIAGPQILYELSGDRQFYVYLTVTVTPTYKVIIPYATV